MISFNKPYVSGNEQRYFNEVINNNRFSGDGPLTIKTTSLLQKLHETLIHSKILLTTSCTDALEMTAILLNIKEGDEVIIPSYTFVSTALAFEMRGAKLIFADSCEDSPHLSISSVRGLITPRTKAIVPVHYAGFPVDMKSLTTLATENNISVVEDNAQGLTSRLHNVPLGTFGTFGTLSFHESKNIQCGEGGALIINDENYFKRAEVIREKGTNRSSFFRAEVNKYGWADLGSSYLMSDILAGFLLAQLESIDFIQDRRLRIFRRYYEDLNSLIDIGIQIPIQSEGVQGNAHIFYLVMHSLEERTKFIEYMKDKGVGCVFHYLSLHKSPYYIDKYSGPELYNADRYSDCLVRLPLYPDLTDSQVAYIIEQTKNFFGV